MSGFSRLASRPKRAKGKRLLRLAVLTALVWTVASAASALAYPRPGRTDRISEGPDGTKGDSYGGYRVALSADGRYVTFESYDSNLVAGDTNGQQDVFVRDRATGTMERLSVASDGTEGDSISGQPSINRDGRYVAFESGAELVSDGLGGGVFVRDRETDKTERVSTAGISSSISADGRYVSFWTGEALVPEDTNDTWDVFLHDRAADKTERVSVASDGTEGNWLSWTPFPNGALSADGRYVVFASNASNLVPNDANGSKSDVFVRDRQTGTTELVSVSSDEEQAEDYSDLGRITPDGRYVVFRSWGPNLVPAHKGASTPYASSGRPDIFVRDRVSGVTERVSVASDGTEPDFGSDAPSISSDGRFVTFSSGATNLTPGETTPCRGEDGTPRIPCSEVYVHDRATGATERVSIAAPRQDSFGGSLLSADGRFVAFIGIDNDNRPRRGDAFLRHRGPAIGVGELTASASANQLSASGWATFSGAVVASATDPSNDGTGGARAKGAEITAASVTHRPEKEDLLLRWGVVDLPSSEGVAGSPDVSYAFDLTAGGTRYRVVARSPNTFTLYRCQPTCAPAETLGGGIGTTGDEVRVAVPLRSLALSEENGLTALRAYTVTGEPGVAGSAQLDELALPAATLPRRSVSVAIAPAGTPEHQVAFERASLSGANFSASLDISSLPAGDYEVWARACLGDECSATKRPLRLGVPGDPPVTTAILDPPAPNGDAGWYRSPVTVTLSAADARSGVKLIEYRLDAGDWRRYESPFTVQADGEHTASFRSTDTDGNREEPKTRSFKLDRTPPGTAATLDPPAPDSSTREGWYRSSVTVTLTAADAISGPAETRYALDGAGYRTYTGAFTVEGGGEHTVTYRSRDRAGNLEEEQSVSFKIDRPPARGEAAPQPQSPALSVGLPAPLDALAPRTGLRPTRRFLISRRATRLTRRGLVRVRVSCRQRTRCRGTLVLRTSARSGPRGKIRAIVLGRRSFRVQAMRRGVVSVRLSASGRRVLAQRGRARVRATATLRRGAAVRPWTARSSFRLVGDDGTRPQ